MLSVHSRQRLARLLMRRAIDRFWEVTCSHVFMEIPSAVAVALHMTLHPGESLYSTVGEWEMHQSR